MVGAGIFGLTAALELRTRGHDVTLVEQGRIPNPLAESMDVSKAVRMDYGADEDYAALGERALAGWRAWNAAWPRIWRSWLTRWREKRSSGRRPTPSWCASTTCRNPTAARS